MKIVSKGKPLKVSKNLLKDACLFYGRYLLSQRLLNNIKVTIEYEKFEKGNYDSGYCSWDDDNRRPREFTITLSSGMSKRQMLLTLAHEMVHVSQYAKGELKDYVRNAARCSWRGEQFDLNNINYWSLPWEREARGYEAELYAFFMDSQRKS